MCGIVHDLILVIFGNFNVKCKQPMTHFSPQIKIHNKVSYQLVVHSTPLFISFQLATYGHSSQGVLLSFTFAASTAAQHRIGIFIQNSSSNDQSELRLSYVVDILRFYVLSHQHYCRGSYMMHHYYCHLLLHCLHHLSPNVFHNLAIHNFQILH